MITDKNEITIKFSEPVFANAENFTKFTLTGGAKITPGETRAITDVSVYELDPDGDFVLNGDDEPIPVDIAADHAAFVGVTNIDHYRALVLTVGGDDPLPPDAIGMINFKSSDDDQTLTDMDGIEVPAKTRYAVTDVKIQTCLCKLPT